jgi:hypothetical protein
LTIRRITALQVNGSTDRRLNGSTDRNQTFITKENEVLKIMYDTLLSLKDSGAVTADGAATVDGAARALDVGTGNYSGVWNVDVTACAVDGGDESYLISLQGGDSADFDGDYIELASLNIGDKDVTGHSIDRTTGRYKIPFTNNVDGTVYPYLRVWTDVTGAAPSVTFSSWLTDV